MWFEEKKKGRIDSVGMNWPADEMEERLVNDEYRIWKKNTPFLYGKPCRPSAIQNVQVLGALLAILVVFSGLLMCTNSRYC